MGELERLVRARRRNQNVQKIILGTLYAAGALSVGLLAPNALMLLQQLEGSGKRRAKNPKYTINESIRRLLEKDLIFFEKTARGRFVRLTSQGEAKLRALDLGGIYKRQSRQRWDGKWRIIIFDIHETRRGIREKIRRALISIGFFRLQHSVWVYPYDCEDLMILLKADLRIGKDVLYLIAERLENDASLRKHFNLKSTT